MRGVTIVPSEPSQSVLGLRLAFVLALGLVSSLLGAQTLASGPVRDASAQQTMSNAVMEMGAAGMGPGSTLTMSGQLPLHGQTSSIFPLTIKARGATDSRAELTTLDGVRTTVIHGGRGMIRKPDGSATFLSPNNTAAFQTPYLPALALQSLANSQSTEIQNLGSTTVDGVALDVVATGLYQGITPGRSEKLADQTRTIFYIQHASGFVARIVRLHYAEGQDGDSQVEDIRYSDYRTVNGVMVPFHQETWSGDQLLFEVNFSTVSFDAAIGDSDFEIASQE